MLSLYYYTIPSTIVYPFYIMIAINPDYCPCYVPIAADYCRYCQTRRIHHRKYFIYSHYARKLQIKWIGYRYRQFCRRIHSKYHMVLHHESVLLQIFKKQYYRKWNVYHWELFLKRFQGNAFKR